MSNPEGYKGRSINTKPLTDYVNNPSWLGMRSARTTLFDIIAMIEQNCKTAHIESIYELFEIKSTTGFNPENTLCLAPKSKSVDLFLANYIKKHSVTKLNQLVIFEVYRKLHNPHLQKIDFSLSMEFKDIGLQGDGKLTLSIIVGYSTNHVCTFKRYNKQWYMIDDQYCYQIEEEMIQYLKGGSDQLDNPLWKKCP